MSDHQHDDADTGKVVIDLRICRLPGCGGPRSEVCINNLSFDECPDIIDAPPESEDGVELPTSDKNPGLDIVRLPGGHALGAAACDALLRQRGGIVVGLVAGPEVGKTTLIATLYELLTRRRMAGFGFAGSETLRGYEERCHLARIASNNAKADTPRTPSKDRLSFTHLSVAVDSSRHDLVFSDRSGEHFEKVLDKPSQIAHFEELHRADVLLILVDLVELLRRPHIQTAAIRKLFMAMDQHGIVGESRTFVVGTKADQAVPTPRSTRAAKALASLAADLSKRSHNAHHIEPRMVACRPRKGSNLVGEGIEPLLVEILQPKTAVALSPSEAWPPEPTELDLLMRLYRAKIR